MPDPTLSVVVPAFNESSRLELSMASMQSFLRTRGKSYEVIVVDDGSSDGTREVAERFARRYGEPGEFRVLRHEPNRGKGFSVRQGMLESAGELALLTDADLSTPIEELARLEVRLRDAALDIVFGSRDLSGSRVEIHQPWWREQLGRGFNRVVRGLTGLPFRDTQCGFKLFRMESCRDLFRCQRIEGFAFDVELLFIARQWGLLMEEAPVIWRHAEGSKVRPLRHASSVIVDLLGIRLNNAKGLYSRGSGSDGPG